MAIPQRSAVARGGTFRIGGSLEVHRLGFGAQWLCGPGNWGPAQDEPAARALLQQAVQLGIDFIDTADVYGPGFNERLIRDTLQPFSDRLVIATKGGMQRSGPPTATDHGFSLNASESHLRNAVALSLHNLGLDCLDLYQLHRVDPQIPIEASVRVLRDLRDAGKIRHIGLSSVSIEQIERARAIVEIATVQNIFNLAVRKHADVLRYCEQHAIGFIAYYPLHAGDLLNSPTLRELAARKQATPAQMALRWLLDQSPVMLVIPGTRSAAHLLENVQSCDIELTAADRQALDSLQVTVTS